MFSVAPFFDNVRGTVTSAPGTGSFTLNTAVYRSSTWATIPGGCVVAYKAVEGTDWENGYGFWNGTTLTRLMMDSSTGSLINFGTGVIVSAIIGGDDVAHYLAGGWAQLTLPTGPSATTFDTFGGSTLTISGSATTASLTNTNALQRQNRVRYLSLTTASANAGWTVNATVMGCRITTTPFLGGFETIMRFGASQLPTGPRAQFGMGTASMGSNEPSALLNTVLFAKDSTDTNIQFMHNDGSGTATKTDTGIPLTALNLYEVSIWNNPGEAKVYGMIMNLATGAGWLGSATTDIPDIDVALGPQCQVGLNAINTGTAAIVDFVSLYCRTGF